MQGDIEVRPDIRCVITRFRLRRRRYLLPTYRDFRRLRTLALANEPPGLLRFAFVVENMTTCYSLSLWSGRPRFSSPVPEHIDVVRRTFGRLRLDAEHGPELWSTTWRLDSASSNLRWGDLDPGQLVDLATREGVRVDAA